jgi:alcohol dehydrogenase class IV
MQIDFATASRIVFGCGVSKSLSELASGFGTRPLFVTGRRTPPLKITGPRFIVSGEPTVQTARDGVAAFRGERCDLVIGIGGGSVLDTAKAVAALATNSGEPLDYLEIVGRGYPLDHDPAPIIAVPTTAGTGSEVTRNAVLGVPEARVKASLRSPRLLPAIAIVDPELTVDLPPDITAYTGLDALTQLIEPFVSSRANVMTDLFCRQGLLLVARSLRGAFEIGHDLDARTDMSYASLLGGLALANAGLGIVHGFAAPIGGMFAAPHGAICASILPFGMKANIGALQSGSTHDRYSEIARILTGRDGAVAEDGINWVASLCKDLRVPSLRTYGIGVEHVHELSQKAAVASSTKANPIQLNLSELERIITDAL